MVGIEFDPVFAQQAEQLILVAPLVMVRFLIEDISLHRRDVGRAHRERAVAFLPGKPVVLSFHPARGI